MGKKKNQPPKPTEKQQSVKTNAGVHETIAKCGCLVHFALDDDVVCPVVTPKTESLLETFVGPVNRHEFLNSIFRKKALAVTNAPPVRLVSHIRCNLE